MSNELKQRLTFAVVGIPIVIWLFFTGGVVLQVFIGLTSAIGMWEYRKMMFQDKLIWTIIDILIAIGVFLFASMVKERFCPSCLISSWAYIAFLFVLQSLLWFARKSEKPAFKNYLLTLWGLIYLAILSGLIFRIDLMYHEKHLLLMLVILIWITDSAAYFIGMKYGKHRGIFPVSPKKSLEGFIAGLLAPFIAVSLIYMFNRNWTFAELSIAALCAGLLGQLGDLLESKLKRAGGVKDSSNLIPGHGGVLDRFDSLLLAGPVMYCLLILVH